jgi:hypothetical protein
MTANSSTQKAPSGETILQDGVSCSRQPPWPSWVSWLTTLTMLPVALCGAYILAHTSPWKLALWLGSFAVFAVPVRYLVCARCPYYGRSCSTQFGRAVPLLFRKQEGRSMRLGLWLDVVFITILFALPVTEAWRLGGLLLLLLWVSMFASMFAVLSRAACSVCPFTFCPIGRAGKALWRIETPPT